MRTFIPVLTLVLFLLVPHAFAQVPGLMSYQGLLTNADGSALSDGTYALTFRLYDAEVGGTELWAETQSINVVGGVFQALLGANTSLGLPFDAPYWLSTQVGNEAELAPRFPLTASPYSLNVRNPLDLYNVPQVQEGDLTAPGDAEDGPARVLVWSQADGVVRWLALSDANGMGDSDWVEDVVNNQVRTARDILLSNGSIPFRVRGSDPAGGATVEVIAQNSTGVNATSDFGDGVRGTSVAGDGVFGTSTNVVGVRGVSTNDAGVRGTSAAANGVEGNATTGIGVRGISADSAGVAGTSTAGDGVAGITNGNGAGVSGRSTGGPGVLGESTTGPGGRFRGDVEVRSNGSGAGKLFLETIEPSPTDPPTSVLVRDPDGFVRQAALPPSVGGGDDDWADTGISVHTLNKSIQLQTPIGTFPFTVASGENPPLRIFAATDNDAIEGNSNSNGVGVRGISAQGNGVEGFANGATGNGVEGLSQSRYGVQGVSNATTGTGTTAGAGVFGRSQLAPGVVGLSTAQQGVMGETESGTGVEGKSRDGRGMIAESERDDALLARTRANDATKAAVRAEGGTTAVGVEASSLQSEGVKGSSEEESGVFGTTNGSISNTKQIGGVTGQGVDAYGTYGSSTMRAGVAGFSQQDHGVSGETDISDPDKAGVYGESSKGASGVYGVSASGPGVRGASASGPAGQFEGEVHILNGTQNARLRIDDMLEDKTAPCLVWAGDMYVKQRQCWTLEDEEGDNGETTTYQVSEFGIRIKGMVNGQEAVVYEVNTDGTSTHKGLETFEAGIKIPLSNGNMAQILPGEGFSIKNDAGNFFFHADPTGNGLFNGFVSVGGLSTSGTVTAGVINAGQKNFRIDHPLDPLNQYLVHTSIESSERLNLYSGNVTTNAEGFATVTVPDWFEALNEDFRYQLTVIGSFAQAIIKEKLVDGQFVIQTNAPAIEVSWQVTGVRHDPWAEAHPTEVEVQKPAAERGRYLHPEAYGQTLPASQSPSERDR